MVSVNGVGRGGWLALTVAVLGALPSLAVASQSKSRCLVENVRTEQHYGTLQEAVDTASAKDTLQVRGTCHGDTTIGKNLTILGKKATLDGQGKTGSAVSVKSATVTITGLTIRGGAAPEVGGGVYNRHGSVALNRVTVTHNSAPEFGVGTERTDSGGGIFSEGTLALDDSTVSDNVNGGITNESENGEPATLTDSTVTGNVGEGIANKGGRVTLDKSRVSRNTGIGIVNTVDLRYFGDAGEGCCAYLTLVESSVTHNLAGGIFNEELGGILKLVDSRVTDNGGET